MKISFLLAAAAILAAGNSVARVRPITEWKGELPAVAPQELETSCAKACEGYDLTVLICSEGQKLVDCEAEGCSYYHKCIPE